MKKILFKMIMSVSALAAAFALVCTGSRVINRFEENFKKSGFISETYVTADTAALSSAAVSETPEDISVPETDSTDSGLESDIKSHEGEKTYPVIESKYTAAGTKFENFYLRNSANVKLNINELLRGNLGFTLSSTTEPQVLIVHTHTCEAYMERDLGYYYESFYPRSTDDSKNVTRVGDKIAEKLSSSGIGIIHDKTHHDDPGYNGSYVRSRKTINSYLQKYPSIKIVLDIHRDALGGGGEEGKIKPTFIVDGKKAAQIMIMSGCDASGNNGFSFWKENLKLALKLQSKAETLYPGMTRPLYFGNFVYNMNVNTGSILIEVGTDANTLDEAMYSGELLGNVLAQVMKENM